MDVKVCIIALLCFEELIFEEIKKKLKKNKKKQ